MVRRSLAKAWATVANWFYGLDSFIIVLVILFIAYPLATFILFKNIP